MKPEQVDKMTLQEACDYAVKKIVEQGGQCRVNGHCSYSGANGRHCVLGWLLDHDDPKLMRYTDGAYSLIDKFADRLPELIRKNREVMVQLQRFHDTESESDRKQALESLPIDTSAPQYQQWVDMAEY